MKLRGKTRKFAKGNKRTEVVPLFAERVTPLMELRAEQPEGTEYVLNKIGNLDQKPESETTNAKGERIRQGRWETNLSTTFRKILKRNGFKVWSQPFHAFRAYRGAELDRSGASQIELDSWIRNSAVVRKRHYSKFTCLGLTGLRRVKAAQPDTRERFSHLIFDNLVFYASRDADIELHLALGCY